MYTCVVVCGANALVHVPLIDAMSEVRFYLCLTDPVVLVHADGWLKVIELFSTTGSVVCKRIVLVPQL